MRKLNFMAGSVKGTAEDRKKANTIGNVFSGVVIAAFVATLLIVNNTYQTPSYDLAENSDDHEINVLEVTDKTGKLISFYTVDNENTTIIDLLEWTEHGYDELDEFLTSLIDAFDDDVTSFSLDQLNVAVIDNNSDNNSYQSDDKALTKIQLIELYKSIKSKS